MNVATLELSKELYELSGWGEKLGESDFYAVNKKGKHAQEANHRPVNWGYYCKKHWDEGVELEREAMS